MKFSSNVPSNIVSQTPLVEYLAKRFTYHNTEEWKECIVSGRVYVNNKKASIADFITAGMVIEYDPGEFEEPEANLSYSIIFEDEWFIGISKPGNLLVHRAGKSFCNNLIYQLRFVHVPPFKDAHTTHRLDRDTSGVVLVAKSSKACAAIGTQFSEGTIKKEYIAIVHGIPDTSFSEISFPIGKNLNSAISYKFCVDPAGKEALTRIIKNEPINKDFTRLLLQPLSGRTHQIRIHLAAIGHPVVGDKLYGLSEDEYLLWRDNAGTSVVTSLFYRHALHCHALTFYHPYLKREYRIEAELPEDMVALIERIKQGQN